MFKFFIAFAGFLFFSSYALADSTLVLSSKNTVSLNDEVKDESMADLMEQISQLNQTLPKGEPIYLVINTPGGSIYAGLELMEFIKGLNRAGRPVDTVTLFSASMGFQFVQAFGKRYIVESGTLMAHRAKGQFEGEFPGEVVVRINSWLKKIKRIDSKVAKRAKMSLREYQKLIADEHWCEGQDCVDEHLADKVVAVSCDSSLDKYSVRTRKEIMDGHTIVFRYYYPGCPLRTGVLDYEIFIDGEPLFPKEFKGERALVNPLQTIKPEDLTKIKNMMNRDKLRPGGSDFFYEKN